MARFKHGTVEIAYLDEGVGDAIVLIHGFASTKEVNWLPLYHSATIADDVRALLDHLAIERADATQMQHADEKCLAINGGRPTLTPRIQARIPVSQPLTSGWFCLWSRNYTV